MSMFHQQHFMELSNRWRPAFSRHTAVIAFATLVVYLLASSSRSLFILLPAHGQFDSVFSLALINYLPPLGTPPRGIDFWLKSDQSCGCSPCCGVQMYHLTDRCVYTSENDPYQPSPGTTRRHDGLLLDGALQNPKCSSQKARPGAVRLICPCAAPSSSILVVIMWALIFVK